MLFRIAVFAKPLRGRGCGFDLRGAGSRGALFTRKCLPIDTPGAREHAISSMRIEFVGSGNKPTSGEARQALVWPGNKIRGVSFVAYRFPIRLQRGVPLSVWRISRRQACLLARFVAKGLPVAMLARSGNPNWGERHKQRSRTVRVTALDLPSSPTAGLTS